MDPVNCVHEDVLNTVTYAVWQVIETGDVIYPDALAALMNECRAARPDDLNEGE